MAAGAQAGGTALSAVGQIGAGNQSASALRRAAQVQRDDAEQAVQAGEISAARQGMIADQKIGSTQAAYGASGVTESGSVLHVIQASHRNAEYDMMNIRYGARVRAVNFENQASMDEIAANNAQVAGYLGAFSSALTGGAKAMSYSDSADGGGGGTATAGESSAAVGAVG